MSRQKVDRNLITVEDISAVLNDIYEKETDPEPEVLYDLMIKGLDKPVKEMLFDLLS